MSPSAKHKNVLCHGDLWANNIPFKYGDDGKPVECCLVDFQLAQVSCESIFFDRSENENTIIPFLIFLIQI